MMNASAGSWPVRVLLVEDDPISMQVASSAFQSSALRYRLDTASDLRTARAMIAEHAPDMVITDLMLPDGRGTELICAEDSYGAYPVVIITGQGDERTAIDALKAGALDYVPKSPQALTDLPHVAWRALREWEQIQARLSAERQLHTEERRLHALLETVPDLILVISPSGYLLDCRGGRHAFPFRKREELVGNNLRACVTPETYGALLEVCADVVRSAHERTIVFGFTLPGWPRYVEARITPYDGDSVLAIIRDVTDQQVIAAKLKLLTRREHDVLRLLVQAKSNKDIARTLTISVKTVEATRARVMKKLNVRNAADLVRSMLAPSMRDSGECLLPVPFDDPTEQDWPGEDNSQAAPTRIGHHGA